MSIEKEREDLIKMCKFCEPTKKQVKKFETWLHFNPYVDDTTDPGYFEEGLRWLLYSDGRFVMSNSEDSGYIRSSDTIKFRYCPKCGRKLKKKKGER